MSVLKKGSSGVAVKVMQEQLVLAGYACATDGKFGLKTEAALLAFQAAAGLRADGAFGPRSADALRAAAAARNRAEPPPAPVVVKRTPVAPAPGTPLTRGAFVDGWHADARRYQLHDLRMGGVIDPKGAVLHTTATAPGGMAGMVRRWCTERGNGSACHFIIGRRAPTASELLDEEWPTQGLVQMAPITRNANHAGGPNGTHGRVMVPGEAKGWHPNAHYVGIELDGACGLQKVGNVYRHGPSQKRIAHEDVWFDERGRPWHAITEYQFEVLGRLFDDLDAVMGRFPDGAKLQPSGSYQLNAVTWGALPGVRFVGHVTLDPVRKRDPGPQGVAWLRERYGSR